MYICATSPNFPEDQAFSFLHAVSQLFSSEKKSNNKTFVLSVNEDCTDGGTAASEADGADGVTHIDGVFAMKKVHKLPCALAKKMVCV